jgi:hypothetical protein
MGSITYIKYLYYLIIKLKNIYYQLVENVFEYNMVLVKGK